MKHITHDEETRNEDLSFFVDIWMPNQVISDHNNNNENMVIDNVCMGLQAYFGRGGGGGG